VRVLQAPEYLADVTSENVKVWSKNGKWSGSDTIVTIRTTADTLRHFPKLQTKDGLLVVFAELIEPRIYRARWAVQSRGVSLTCESGWIIKGYHVTAQTLDAAKRKAAKARAAALQSTLKAKQHRRQAAVAAASAAEARKQELQRLQQVFVTLDDSLAAGNCRPASEMVASQMWARLGAAGPCAVRADLLLSFRDDSYTRRAVAVAVAR
jgi:hypothetical protein